MSMFQQAQNLEAFLRGEIPLAKAMNLRIERCDQQGLELFAPLADNFNDKGTGFAGSIASVAALAGWAWVTCLLRDQLSDHDVALYWSEMHYDKPVRSDFTGICQAPDAIDTAAFIEQLQKKGKAKLELSVEVHDDQVLAARFQGKYAAWPKPQSA